MTSLSVLSTNYKKENESEKEKKNPVLYKNSISSFKVFDSALFMSEFQGAEENISLSLEKSNEDNKGCLSSNSNIKNIQDLKLSPSLEKCLTNELLNSITNDSNNNKKIQNPNFNSYSGNIGKFSNDEKKHKIVEIINNTESQKNNFLKITKKLFNHGDIDIDTTDIQEKKNNSNFKKVNDKKSAHTLYEESINGFEYQLKFIENSVHNILPKSYKKFISKNNDYNNSKNNQRTLDNKFTNRENNFDNNNDFNKKQNHHQVHKLKMTYNNYSNWICNYCNCLNRGYRKVCANCSNYRNL